MKTSDRQAWLLTIFTFAGLVLINWACYRVSTTLGILVSGLFSLLFAYCAHGCYKDALKEEQAND